MPAFFFAQNPGKVLNRQNFIGVFQKAWVQGMMISNVIGCFRATGVYPIDRRVPLSHLSEETSVSTRSASTPYVPFCTPRKEGDTDDRPACTELPQPPTFTVDEVEQFQARFLESADSRYALWLEKFYPQSHPKARPGVLETIPRRPPPPPAQRKADKYPLNCGRVLTSEQCIREKEEKAEEKKKKQEEKETE